MTQAGDLFCPDEFEGKYIPPQPVLKSFCLNISHDCNLRCRYCFAGTGAFGGARLNKMCIRDSFYTHPNCIQDLVDGVVARILDRLGVPHELGRRWQGGTPL